jgi:hypothetical protein
LYSFAVKRRVNATARLLFELAEQLGKPFTTSKEQ